MAWRRAALALLALVPLVAGNASAACQPTERDALGPYYLPGAPAQHDLCPEARGERLTVSGVVRGMPDCMPAAGAVVEVWQADAHGRYSGVPGGIALERGCPLRATLRADAAGRYEFTTIVPGVYPGRPRHLHLRVSHPAYRTLVTQLYFRGDPGLPADFSLAVPLTRGGTPAASAGVFDIVLTPR